MTRSVADYLQEQEEFDREYEKHFSDLLVPKEEEVFVDVDKIKKEFELMRKRDKMEKFYYAFKKDANSQNLLFNVTYDKFIYFINMPELL